MTPSISSSRDSRVSAEVSRAVMSAVMVTGAAPLVGMPWLMVRMLAPVPANTASTSLKSPILCRSMSWKVTIWPPATFWKGMTAFLYL